MRGGRNECSAAFLPAMEASYNVQKYFKELDDDDDDNMISSGSCIRNEMYKVQQKVKKQQLTVWNCGPIELDDILMQYTELEHSFNVIHH